jgi:hypothetical protein
MKLLISICCSFLFTLTTNAQEIVNLVLVGNAGITEDIKKAHSFIVIKKYPTNFKRLDYKIAAPMEKLKTYSDSTLTILEGEYYEYDNRGNISIAGMYENNNKEREWAFYDDTGKVTRLEYYTKGVLTKTINPDTVKKEMQTYTIAKVESEAAFSKTPRAWIKYLTDNLRADVGALSFKGGQVVVSFVVDTTGKCVKVHLFKSVEFILDEEATRIIEKSPLWELPAIQNGRKAKAYRRQPVTFTIDEE